MQIQYKYYNMPVHVHIIVLKLYGVSLEDFREDKGFIVYMCLLMFLSVTVPLHALLTCTCTLLYMYTSMYMYMYITYTCILTCTCTLC